MKKRRGLGATIGPSGSNESAVDNRGDVADEVIRKIHAQEVQLGQPNNQPTLVKFSTKIPEKLQRQIKVHCAQHGIKIQEFTVTALRDYLAHQDSN